MNFTLERINCHHIAGVHARHIALNRQRAGILGSVKEDRGDFSAQHNTAGAFVRQMGNVLPHIPLHRVDRRFTRGAGAHDVAHIGERQAFFFELGNRCQPIGHFINQHGLGVQRDIGTRPSFLRRREIIGIGFARNFKHDGLDLFRQRCTQGEPLGVGPGFEQGFGVDIARSEFFHHIVEGIENQHGMRQGLHRIRRQRGIVEQIDQRMHVVTAEHGAEHLHRVLAANQRRGDFALRDIGKKRGFHIGGFIHAGRHAVFQQTEQIIVFPWGRVFDQLN